MGAQSGLQIAIVGGGVCGLTCAIALAQRGVHVEIFEAAVSFLYTYSVIRFLTSVHIDSQNLEKLVQASG